MMSSPQVSNLVIGTAMSRNSNNMNKHWTIVFLLTNINTD